MTATGAACRWSRAHHGTPIALLRVLLWLVVEGPFVTFHVECAPQQCDGNDEA
jgi:hypothetical protein